MAGYLQPDICVIGGGSGGLTVAAAARALGASVVLIEKGRMGGDCLNSGCVPSKSLIASAKRAHTIAHTAMFGISTDELRVNFGRINEHVHHVIDAIAPHDSVERFTAMGVTVLQTKARFIDRRTVEADGQLIRARRFVIATGSRPAAPPIEGLGDVDYLTNESIFELTRKPQHLIVIGGGPIGIELAQAHRRLGAEVTVIEMDEALAKDDPELTAIALRAVTAEGVRLITRAKVQKVENQGQQIAVSLQRDGAEEGDEPEIITGSHLLIAAGRTPGTADMGLDKARVRLLPDGAVRVRKNLKSSNRRIYAIGDVAGGLQFTHVAGYHAGLVVRNALFGLPVAEKRSIIPWATYTDPEIANVGMTEADAKRAGRKFRIIRISYAEVDRAQAERRTEGLLKLVVAGNGRILGAGIAGLQAGELISFFAYALANNMKVGSFTKFIAPYPTLAEITKKAATEFYRDQAGNPWLQRLRRLNSLLP